MPHVAVALTLSIMLFGGAFANAAAQSSQLQSGPVVASRLITVTGVFSPADGGTPNKFETVTVAIYADQTGGTPLWQETQTIPIDGSGRYTLLLGASTAEGVPLSVFAAGEAQWMGITWTRAGEVEGARTPLTSVPYALKAADAETLAGLPVSAFQLAPKTEEAGVARLAATSTDFTTNATLSGTPGTLAKYVNGIDLGSSSLFEIGGRLGVNTSNPFDNIHSQFLNTNGAITGLAVQNLGNTATSYSGMLFFDQHGNTAQFQGFNNVTHEYRINNIAKDYFGTGAYNGSINFMIGGASRLKVDSNGSIGIGTTTPAFPLDVVGAARIVASSAPIALLVGSSGSETVSVINANPTGAGVYGSGPQGYGLWGSTDTGTALLAIATNKELGWAGQFAGDVNVIGELFKAAGAFRIDHPLDPENKYLLHSFVESPDMKNIYDGVATLNESGEAVVVLPEWFEALNQDFRYQLTPMGAAFVPYVSQEVAGNQFKIAGGVPGKKVSWQVTGIRHDAYANANRLQVEEYKSEEAAGTYLHPEAFGLAADKGRSKAAATAQSGKGDVKALGAGDNSASRSEEAKSRLRAISQKPSKKQ